MSTAVHVDAGPVVADVKRRRISGLVVPWGKAGHTSAGLVSFARGSLSWNQLDPGRIKLLHEHDQAGPVLGYAVEVEELERGLYVVFYVPETVAGDQALVEVEQRLRDSFSPGVQLDDATSTNLRRARGAAVRGRGTLREVSLVCVPAYEAA